MFSHLRADIRRYGNPLRAAYSHPAFLGVVWYRISRALWLGRSNPLWFIGLLIARGLYPLVRMYSGLELSPLADIGPGLWIGHHGPTVIHPNTIAGSNLTILHSVTIGEGRANKVPRIGNDVRIATGAILFGGITIGDGARIGAGAVVTHDVPSGTTVYSERKA